MEPYSDQTTSITITKFRHLADKLAEKIRAAGVDGVKVEQLYSVTVPAGIPGAYLKARAVKTRLGLDGRLKKFRRPRPV